MALCKPDFGDANVPETNVSTLPKHRAIELDLLSQIKKGRLVVGQQVATGIEISRKYGVSVPTADKAIGSLAGKGYLERLRGRGTFVKDWRKAERNNAVGQSVVVTCTSGELSFYSQFMDEACAEAESHGYSLIYSRMGDGPDCAAPLPIRREHAVGSLVIGNVSEQQADALRKEDIPHVFVGTHRNTFGWPCVCHDVTNAAYQITRLLLELDRGPIWLVTQPSIDVYYSQELQDGYQQAVFESSDGICNMHVSRNEEDDAFYDRLVRQMIVSGQEHFPMIVNYTYGCRLMEHLKRNKIDFERTSIVVVCCAREGWLNRDRLTDWEFSLTSLMREGVRELIAAVENGAPISGKGYKLRLEPADDPVKLFKCSWQ